MVVYHGPDHELRLGLVERVSLWPGTGAKIRKSELHVVTGVCRCSHCDDVIISSSRHKYRIHCLCDTQRECPRDGLGYLPEVGTGSISVDFVPRKVSTTRHGRLSVSPAIIVCSLPRCMNHSFHESFHMEYIPPLRRPEIKGNGVIHGKSDSCIWGVNILLSQG